MIETGKKYISGKTSGYWGFVLTLKIMNDIQLIKGFLIVPK
jgi:hypothetical protein